MQTPKKSPYLTKKPIQPMQTVGSPGPERPKKRPPNPKTPKPETLKRLNPKPLHPKEVAEPKKAKQPAGKRDEEAWAGILWSFFGCCFGGFRLLGRSGFLGEFRDLGGLGVSGVVGVYL